MSKLFCLSILPRTMLTLPGLCLLFALAMPALADTQVIGGYTVHYIAVNSTFLDADIAAQYNIVRSARRGFLNIAVLRDNADGSTTPVTALVSGGRKNLLQQNSELEFNEVREGDAIYYLAQFEFSNAENLRFSIDVQPEQQGKVYPIQWNTVLYAD